MAGTFPAIRFSGLGENCSYLQSLEPVRRRRPSAGLLSARIGMKDL
jgi:hypothetical protein